MCCLSVYQVTRWNKWYTAGLLCAMCISWFCSARLLFAANITVWIWNVFSMGRLNKLFGINTSISRLQFKAWHILSSACLISKHLDTWIQKLAVTISEYSTYGLWIIPIDRQSIQYDLRGLFHRRAALHCSREAVHKDSLPSCFSPYSLSPILFSRSPLLQIRDCIHQHLQIRPSLSGKTSLKNAKQPELPDTCHRYYPPHSKSFPSEKELQQPSVCQFAFTPSLSCWECVFTYLYLSIAHHSVCWWKWGRPSVMNLLQLHRPR